ncbi:hypothetical protein F5Y18DRAFT_418237 [Xylariaceae sp. FL1019]|nr:hypothetical protein F5Y18DRAFT_418237 [Xylariaceae sp. FL1019]
MIVRSTARCCRAIRPIIHRQTPQYARQTRRRYSIPASPSPAGSPTSSAGMLAPFTNEFDRIAPSFKIDGSQIQIMTSPSDFYETLKSKIRHAKKRIFLSTLYIGKSEKELLIKCKITTLQEALRNNPELKLSILTDALRGTREAPDPSCASLLAPLITEFGPDRVEIHMYHTPNLTGLRKKYIPKRINEGWGLQHMKLYGVDDEIILSGANLSEDYFTNRLDRYQLFASKEITEYFFNLYQGVASLSFRVEPSQEPGGFQLHWPSANAAPSPLEQPKEYISRSTALISKLISLGAARTSITDDTSKKDTTVYMLGQLSQLMKPNASTELPVVTHLLKTLAEPQYSNSSWTFTAGYFNPDPSLRNLLLSTASQNNTVITASPWANGFYGSKGVSGMLPSAYTYLARKFLREVHQRKRDSVIVLKEWRKGTVGEPGAWTYHAKGLWVTLPGEAGPSINIIGSSNYTKRSYSHDLEAGALVVTQNEGLKKRLKAEQEALQGYAKPVTLDEFSSLERRVGLHIRISMLIVTLVGGAL